MRGSNGMQCRCCLAQCPIHPLTDELPFSSSSSYIPPLKVESNTDPVQVAVRFLVVHRSVESVHRSDWVRARASHHPPIRKRASSSSSWGFSLFLIIFLVSPFIYLFIFFFLFLLLFSFLIIIYILDLHHHTRSWKAFICFGSRARRWRGRWARAPAGHARKSGLFSKKFVGALFCFLSSSFFSILIFLVLHILVVVYRQEYISFSSFFFFLITFYPVHPCRNLWALFCPG